MKIDNVNKKVVDILTNLIQDKTKLSLMSKQFSIYAFEQLQNRFHQMDSARLIFTHTGDTGMPFGELNGSESENHFRNQLTQKQIAQTFKAWVSTMAQVRLADVNTNLVDTIMHTQAQSAMHAITGAQFDASGLGLIPSRNLTRIRYVEHQEAQDELEYFDEVWENPQVQDALAPFMHQLSQLTQDYTPNFIYFKMLFHLFHDFVDNMNSETMLQSQVNFKQTSIWSMLYKFQKDGVIGAIDKLEKFNGCILADSVGLGKTFEALAVIKYYELRRLNVLVLCPKKLSENWKVYKLRDKRNPLQAEQFHYDVLYHTDLSREEGMSGDLNLQHIDWDSYGLIVIDESHNFRNAKSTEKDKKSRYQKLLEDVIQSQEANRVPKKVLMLSATPVNSKLRDLKSQLAFITQGHNHALQQEGIKSIEATLRDAQTRFNGWIKKDISERTSKNLLQSLNFDYFKLLDIYTIARSRKHIQKYYGIEEIGHFPERLPPINVKASIASHVDFPPLEQVNTRIRQLKLSAYSTIQYILPERLSDYETLYDQHLNGQATFKQIDREANLINLMRINLLKRLESSVYSFGITVNNLFEQVNTLLTKLNDFNADDMQKESLSLGDKNAELDLDAPELEPYTTGKKIKVYLSDLDRIRFKEDLQHDYELLVELRHVSQNVTPDKDTKLDYLKQKCREKIQNPINANNKKIIVFTVYSDTAEYLYEQISAWALKDLGLNCALITGQKNKTTLPSLSTSKTADFSSILMDFSPRSKNRDKVLDGAMAPEIDLLIATDCISEGQNLQDGDYLINYDIHWNPVRIIQRFGRIDRLGSQNQKIQLVNFWPHMDLEAYINLEARVTGRMALLNVSATGEEDVTELDADAVKKMNDFDYRRKQLQKLQSQELDFEDISGGVSLTDLTLNDLKMDLKNYTDDNPDGLKQLETAPVGLFAPVLLTRSAFDPEVGSFYGLEHEIQSGAIFCLKDLHNKVPVAKSSALVPYFMVYVTDASQVLFAFNEAKQILDLCKKIGSEFYTNGQSKEAYEAFANKTNDGQNMQHYTDLLESAVEAIIGKSEELSVSSLFSSGGTTLSQPTSKSVSDFEVISYFVIL
jgi:SNF2 family DNA or RNA helicase